MEVSIAYVSGCERPGIADSRACSNSPVPRPRTWRLHFLHLDLKRFRAKASSNTKPADTLSTLSSQLEKPEGVGQRKVCNRALAIRPRGTNIVPSTKAIGSPAGTNKSSMGITIVSSRASADLRSSYTARKLVFVESIFSLTPSQLEHKLPLSGSLI